MNGIHRRRDWAELARYAEACVDPDLTPAQQLQRLSMLLAILEEITAGLEQEADAAAKRPRILVEPLSAADGGGWLASVPDLPGCASDGETPDEALKNVQGAIESWREAAEDKRNLGDELLEGVREIKAGGGSRHQVG